MHVTYRLPKHRSHNDKKWLAVIRKNQDGPPYGCGQSIRKQILLAGAGPSQSCSPLDGSSYIFRLLGQRFSMLRSPRPQVLPRHFSRRSKALVAWCVEHPWPARRAAMEGDELLEL